MRRLITALVAMAIIVVTPTAASALWAGYESNAGDYPIKVSAKVTIPWFNCDRLDGDNMVAPWVGVDVIGVNTENGREVYLSQTGSTMFCNRQTGSHWVSVWWENWPERPFNIPGVTAESGDTLYYEIVVRPHVTEYFVENRTTNESWTQSFAIEQEYKPSDRYWIAECYQGANWDQPNHGKITFVRPEGYPGTAKEYDTCDEEKVSEIYSGNTKFDVSSVDNQ